MDKQDAIMVDYGPAFTGAAVRTDEGIACVVPRQNPGSAQVRATMRELVHDLGGDCGRCSNCPVGQLG